MYETYWGLSKSPFSGNLDPMFFYQSPTHEEALARLQFLVDQRRRLGLLTGPSGSGKSLLLEVFRARLHREGRPVAKLSLLGIEPVEMLWQLAAEWGLVLDGGQSAASLWRRVTDRLIEYRYQQLDAVVLLDDVDQAAGEVLQHVVRLAAFDSSPETRLCLVLAGRNEALPKLGSRLLDLADLRIDVEPWGSIDTERFVATLLAKAGQESAVFTPQAITRLHERSHGIARRLSQLADLALVAGAGAGLRQIDADVVDAVCQELAVPLPTHCGLASVETSETASY
jgi:type II secretory pathway predicted ATPase ExeA